MGHDTTLDLLDQEVNVGPVKAKGGREHARLMAAHWIVWIQGVVHDPTSIDDGTVSVLQKQDCTWSRNCHLCLNSGEREAGEALGEEGEEAVGVDLVDHRGVGRQVGAPAPVDHGAAERVLALRLDRDVAGAA